MITTSENANTMVADLEPKANNTESTESVKDEVWAKFAIVLDRLFFIFQVIAVVIILTKIITSYEE